MKTDILLEFGKIIQIYIEKTKIKSSLPYERRINHIMQQICSYGIAKNIQKIEVKRLANIIYSGYHCSCKNVDEVEDFLIDTIEEYGVIKGFVVLQELVDEFFLTFYGR